MVTHARDLTSYGNEGAEFELNPDAPVGKGGARPNTFTRYAEPGKVESRVRLVDQVLRGQVDDVEQKACPKGCGFRTASKDAFIYHTRQDSAGLILCEREKANFQEQEKCAACEGKGEKVVKDPATNRTKMLPCSNCSGMGYLQKTGAPKTAAPALDVDALAAKITAGLAQTLNAGFASVVEMLKGSAKPEPEKPKKQKKGKSDDGRPRERRGGAQAAGPAPGPVLGQGEQPVADPPTEPQ